MFKSLLAAIACLCATVAFSQKNELSGLVTMESPKGDLGTIYSSGPLLQITYAKNTKYKKKLNSVGVNVGYMSMNPIQSVFTYPVVTDLGTVTGTASYSTYHSYQLMANMRTGRQLGKSVDMFWGSDIGLNFTTYDYTLHSPGIDESGSNNIARYVFAPKLGINIALSKSLYFMLQTRYVLSLGKNDNESSILNTYVSLGGGVAVRF
jgi:hypothetical protein